LKILPWRDQLIMLVLDERSAPSTDVNPDIVEEMLAKSGRLWTLRQGDAVPRLLQPAGMPDSISSFVIESDQLWVGGDGFGYLDLKDRSFHPLTIKDPGHAPDDHLLGFARGKLHLVRNYRVSLFDPVSSTAKELVRPEAGIYVDDRAAFAFNDRWFCYAAGSAQFFKFEGGWRTNVQDIALIDCIDSEPNGFWMGGTAPLCLLSLSRASLDPRSPLPLPIRSAPP
jgi:hypothetical protein